MRQLSDFINHGILPFVGRAAILEEIAAFRRKTVRRGQLELFLIEAPAGRGKSRLVEAITTQLDGDDSGIVLHLRFYPETPMHLSSELLRDVERVARRIGLTLDDERGAPGNLPQKLRRLVRLRPTLLIIEDLHLLPTDRRDGFLRFFEDFVDEPLPTLVLARPLDSELSGRIEPYRVRSIDLPGLDVDDVARLWQELFATKPKPAILAAIVETTTGNPLAIRSALRGPIPGRRRSSRARSRKGSG